jgi:hypothetical protein
MTRSAAAVPPMPPQSPPTPPCMTITSTAGLYACALVAHAVLLWPVPTPPITLAAPRDGGAFFFFFSTQAELWTPAALVATAAAYAAAGVGVALVTLAPRDSYARSDLEAATTCIGLCAASRGRLARTRAMFYANAGALLLGAWPLLLRDPRPTANLASFGVACALALAALAAAAELATQRAGTAARAAHAVGAVGAAAFWVFATARVALPKAI